MDHPCASGPGARRATSTAARRASTEPETRNSTCPRRTPQRRWWEIPASKHENVEVVRTIYFRPQPGRQGGRKALFVFELSAAPPAAKIYDRRGRGTCCIINTYKSPENTLSGDLNCSDRCGNNSGCSTGEAKEDADEETQQAGGGGQTVTMRCRPIRV